MRWTRSRRKEPPPPATSRTRPWTPRTPCSRRPPPAERTPGWDYAPIPPLSIWLDASSGPGGSGGSDDGTDQRAGSRLGSLGDSAERSAAMEVIGGAVSSTSLAVVTGGFCGGWWGMGRGVVGAGVV